MQDPTIPDQLPPFSPMLFAGLALRPFPVVLLNPLVKHVLRRVEGLYPEIFERLAPMEHSRFLIVPIDLHCCFLLSLGRGEAAIEVVSKGRESMDIDATISGPMVSLLQLMEGSVDGDALFFSRDLNVEGDTEAVLTLRNAVDSVDISLEHILVGKLAPFRPYLAKILSKTAKIYGRAEQDFRMVHGSLIEPIMRRVAQIDDDLHRQENRMIKIEKEIRQLKSSRRKTVHNEARA